MRMKSGPLAGMEGVLLRRKGSFRLVISIELIQRSVAVDADAADVEPSRRFLPTGAENGPPRLVGARQCSVLRRG